MIAQTFRRRLACALGKKKVYHMPDVQCCRENGLANIQTCLRLGASEVSVSAQLPEEFENFMQDEHLQPEAIGDLTCSSSSRVRL